MSLLYNVVPTTAPSQKKENISKISKINSRGSSTYSEMLRLILTVEMTTGLSFLDFKDM